MKPPPLIDYPFPLPKDFLARLGYESYQIPPEFVRMAREQYGAEVHEFAPRRLVGVYWEPCGDEAAWDDGRTSFCGANWEVLLQMLHGAPGRWLHELALDLGSSDAPALHWLIVDRETGRAWVAPVTVARWIVQHQSLTLDERSESCEP